MGGDIDIFEHFHTQSTFTFSELTMKTLEQGVKDVQG